MQTFRTIKSPLIVGVTATVLFPLISGMMSLSFGQRINWDLLSYHGYNGYAFLEHRLGFDIAPAGTQTFYNPALDILFYWMVKNLSSRQIAFGLGFVQGFNFTLLFFIFWKLTIIANRWLKYLLGIFCILVSFIAPAFIWELGRTSYDNIVSIFVLSSLLLLVYTLELIRRQKGVFTGWPIITAAALVMGVGVGLKFPVAIYAVSAGISILPFLSTWRNKVAVLLIFGIAGMTGFLISNGFWLHTLWVTFGNPLFPFYNSIFQSPYIAKNWHFTYYEQYIPKHLWEYLIWPLIFSRDSKRVIGNAFVVDIRFGLVYLFLLGGILRLALKRYLPRINSRFVDSRGANFFLLFFCLSFVLWTKLFSYYRFLISLELIVPVVIIILLEKLFNSTEARVGIAICTTLAVFLTFNPSQSSSLDRWTDHYFEVDPWPFSLSDNTVVLMLGPSPMGYIIPSMPPQIRFVRPDWNFVPIEQQGIAYTQIKKILRSRQADIYVLYNNLDTNSFNIDDSLSRFNLKILPNECNGLKTNILDELVICRLSHYAH